MTCCSFVTNQLHVYRNLNTTFILRIVLYGCVTLSLTSTEERLLRIFVEFIIRIGLHVVIRMKEVIWQIRTYMSEYFSKVCQDRS